MTVKLLSIVLVAATLTPAAASSVPALVAAARAGAPASLRAGALGTIDLALREVDMLVPGAPITLDGRPFAFEPFWTLQGTVAGEPDSDVRLTVTHDEVAGVVRARGRTVWLDPWAPAGTAAGDAREDRIDEVAVPFHHGAASVAAGVGNCSITDCGTLTAMVMLDADATFTLEDVGTCPARQIATLTAVTSIFEASATDIELRAAGTNCSTTSHGTAFGEPLLVSLAAAWRDAGPSRSTLLHVVGSDLTGSSIGIAYQPGVCVRYEPSFTPERCEYGLAAYQSVASGGSYTGSLAHRAKLAAHELGHNFNAEHADAASCGSADGTLMCPTFKPSGPDAFSAANAARIRSHAEATIGSLVCAAGTDGEPLGGC